MFHSGNRLKALFDRHWRRIDIDIPVQIIANRTGDAAVSQLDLRAKKPSRMEISPMEQVPASDGQPQYGHRALRAATQRAV